MTKEQFSRELGKRMSAARLQRGMTQENVAEAANISIPYYSQIENGAKSISAFYLASVAKALNVSADYLLYGKDSFSQDSLLELFQRFPDGHIESIAAFCDYLRDYMKALLLSHNSPNDAADAPKETDK